MSAPSPELPKNDTQERMIASMRSLERAAAANPRRFGGDPYPTLTIERLHEDVATPLQATPEAAGYDLFAYLTGTKVEIRWGGEVAERGPDSDPDDFMGTPFIDLLPGAVAKIPLGFRTVLPPGYEAQIRPRSGTSFKTDLVIANAPGTIDADFRGEWRVLVRNVGTVKLRLFHGQAIAQAVFARYETLPFTQAPVPTDDTERDPRGFGTTDPSP